MEMIETKHDLLTTKYTKVLEEADPNTRQNIDNIAWAFIRGMAFMELLRSREKQCQK